MQIGETAYYIEAPDIVESAKIVNIVEPSEADAKIGAQTLYEFENGIATANIFKTEEEAREGLTKAPYQP